jgi:hypothetical protein
MYIKLFNLISCIAIIVVEIRNAYQISCIHAYTDFEFFTNISCNLEDTPISTWHVEICMFNKKKKSLHSSTPI